MSFEKTGIDVSKYQGKINWKSVADSGIYFSFIRIGYSNYDGSISEGFDPYFYSNITNSISNGLKTGIYVYSYCTDENSAIKCADSVITYAKQYNITMPIAFDYEDSKLYASYGKAKNTSICLAFLNRIKQHGYYPILYTYTSFINSYLDSSKLQKYDKWIADYRGYCGYNGDYGIWQYSSSGSVPGISGRCDMNIMYKNYPSIINIETGGDNMENISNLIYRVKIKNKCQGFSSKNTNNTIKINGSDYLPVGDYKLINKENTPAEEGFYWCEIRLPDSSSCYAVYDLPDNRCEIVDISYDTPVKNKSIRIIKENKNQAFYSRNTNDVVSFGESNYIPTGIYPLITMDSSPKEDGFVWSQFRYTDGNSYYVITNIDDGRCEVIDTSSYEPEPEYKPEPKPENKVTREEFDSLKMETAAIKKDVDLIKSDYVKNTEFNEYNESFIRYLNELKDLINTKSKSIDELTLKYSDLSNEYSKIVKWIKSFE